MKINPPDSGLYVIAVSGGVDSMVLLDLLSKRRELELVVAHFNHGIRDDAAKDEELVGKAAKKLGLVFGLGYGKLGAAASEDQARKARYAFLEAVRTKYGAKAIITAHHQDDMIETAIINVLRGSGRKGLTAIKDNPEILRPLINIPKKELVEYAKAQKIVWRDDKTNQDPRYLRNYIRLGLSPKLSDTQRRQIVKNIDKVAKNKQELDSLIATLSRSVVKNGYIDRSKFTSLPTELCRELVAYWLREHGMKQFDRRTVERLSLGLKIAKPHTEVVAGKDLRLVLGAASAHFSNR
jgi:tRNA(Ile)-lysidine synthetase-like protein